MQAELRANLVSEALKAFGRDLNLAVAIVTPRKTVMKQARVEWGTPPRFVVGELPPGRTELSS